MTLFKRAQRGHQTSPAEDLDLLKLTAEAELLVEQLDQTVTALADGLRLVLADQAEQNAKKGTQ